MRIDAERLARTERLRLHVLEGLAADREVEGMMVLPALTLVDDAATLIGTWDGVAAAPAAATAFV